MDTPLTNHGKGYTPQWGGGGIFTLFHITPVGIIKSLLDSLLLGLHIGRFGLFFGGPG